MVAPATEANFWHRVQFYALHILPHYTIKKLPILAYRQFFAYSLHFLVNRLKNFRESCTYFNSAVGG